MSKKIYISGGMRNYPDLNYPLFDKATELWRNKGFAVLNPAENFDGRKDIPYETCIKKDIEQLETECDSIALLPGWEASEGARKELGVALSRSYKVFDAILGHELDSNICKRKLSLAEGMYPVKPEEKAVPLAIKSMELVNKTRQADYGSPDQDFSRAGGMMSSLGYCFRDPITKEYRSFAARDIPVFMTCVKLSRLVNKFSESYYHVDSVLDIHGYLNTLEQLYEKKT